MSEQIELLCHCGAAYKVRKDQVRKACSVECNAVLRARSAVRKAGWMPRQARVVQRKPPPRPSLPRAPMIEIEGVPVYNVPGPFNDQGLPI